MGSISVSGTVSAALILALVALTMTPAAAVTPAPFSIITVDVTGLRNVKGNVLICLTANAKAFPDCSKDGNATRVKIAAAKTVSIPLAVNHAGPFAISVIHDENANGKMDMTLFLPKEGFGFSRNPKIGMGPPKFANAAFAVAAGETKVSVAIKYIL